MKNKYIWWIVGIVVVAGLIWFLMPKTSSALVNPTPSTNAQNAINGWANVVQVVKGEGTTDLKFISTRHFASCFEYRTDGDVSQIKTENGGNNYNTLITDGLYPYTCQNFSSTTKTIIANGYVEVRMVFGAESDERFTWTRFDVNPVPAPAPAPAPKTSAGGQSGGGRHPYQLSDGTWYCPSPLNANNDPQNHCPHIGGNADIRSLQIRVVDLLNQLIALLRQRLALQ